MRSARWCVQCCYQRRVVLGHWRWALAETESTQQQHLRAQRCVSQGKLAAPGLSARLQRHFGLPAACVATHRQRANFRLALTAVSFVCVWRTRGTTQQASIFTGVAIPGIYLAGCCTCWGYPGSKFGGVWPRNQLFLAGLEATHLGLPLVGCGSAGGCHPRSVLRSGSHQWAPPEPHSNKSLGQPGQPRRREHHWWTAMRGHCLALGARLHHCGAGHAIQPGWCSDSQSVVRPAPPPLRACHRP